MKESSEDVAAELRRLQPVPPSADLTRRVQEAIAAAPSVSHPVVRVRRWRGRWAWAPVAVACAALILVALWPSRETIQPAKPERPVATVAAAPPEPAWRRVDAEHYLVHAEESGIVYAGDTIPLRQLRYQVVDLSRWVDDREQMVIDVIRPREEMVFVPVNVY